MPTSAKGRHRRQLLLQAAGEVVMESGIAAVSHRAVARRAGLPLAATTYYFDTLEDLLLAAMPLVADRWLATARETAARAPRHLTSPGELAGAALDVVALAPSGVDGAAPTTLLTLYERYLEAARHPQLQPLVREYNRRIDALVLELLGRSTLPRTEAFARVVVATADGALMRALAEGADLVSARDTLTALVDRHAPAAEA